MSRTITTAAVVLAAGSSSRMGTTKALLPLGRESVIERVLGSVSKAGVDQVVVVTGHDAERLSPLLERLGVRRAHNARHAAGMFSSVQTGVRALPPDVDAFFVLPVDCALVRPEVLRMVDTRYRETECGVREQEPATATPILYPTCLGRRGHPPLISGGLRQEILAVEETGDLRSLLARHADCEVDVEVEDLTILLDMDTPEDYRRLVRFAAHLAEADGAGGQALAAALHAEDALHLLALLEAPTALVRHCRTVSFVGAALAQAVTTHRAGAELDVDLVRSAGLLHDLAKGSPKHAAVAQRLLAGLGLRRLGEVVGAHMVLPENELLNPRLTEAQLVYLADKLVVEDRVTGLEERTARALRAHAAGGTASSSSVESRMEAARVIAERVEQATGQRLDAILSAMDSPA